MQPEQLPNHDPNPRPETAFLVEANQIDSPVQSDAPSAPYVEAVAAPLRAETQIISMAEPVQDRGVLAPVQLSETAESTPTNRRSLKFKVVAALLAAGGAVGLSYGAVEALHPGETSHQSVVNLPPVTSAPPLEAALKPIAAAKPAQNQRAKAPAVSVPEQLGATKQTKPEIVAPERQLLPIAEIQSIIATTGFEGLKNHRFEVVEAYDSAAAHIVVVSLDGAPLAVPVAEIKTDIAAAEAEAATRPSFSASLQLGPGAKQAVTFDVAPSQLQSSGRDTHYLLFAGSKEDLTALASPVVASPNAFTASSPFGGPNGRGLNVTLIRRDEFDKAANSLSASVEAFQTSTSIRMSAATEQILDKQHTDLSYMKDPNVPNPTPQDEKRVLDNLGREIINNSMGFAKVSAQAGLSYGQYRAKAPTTLLMIYGNNNKLFHFAVSSTEYSAFRS
jgi:hypothetical protein